MNKRAAILNNSKEIAKVSKNQINNAGIRYTLIPSSIKSLLCLLILLLLTNITSGQGVDQNARGSGQVNPVTRGMELSIPLANYQGRKLNLPVALSYTSKLWQLETFGNYPTNTPRCNRFAEAVYSKNSASGWTSTIDRPIIEYTGRNDLYDENGSLLSIDIDCDPGAPGPSGNSYVRRINVRFPGGGVQEFRASDEPEFYPQNSNCDDNNPSTPCPVNFPFKQENWNRTYYSTDGSGMRYVEDSVTETYRLWMTDGSYYDFGALETGSSLNLRKGTKLTDVNGNQIVYHSDQPTVYPNGYWKDTMGREIPIPFVPVVPTQVSTQDYLIPGITTAYKFHWKKLEDSLAQTGQELYYAGDSDQLFNTYSPSLFQHGSITYSSDYLYPLARKVNGQAVRFNPIVLAQIELPNGKFYDFKYNVYGEIEKVIYPTTSEERFEYEKVAPLGRISGAYDQANRGVKKRHILENSSATPITWTYQSSANGEGYEVKIINPDGTWNKSLFHRSNYHNSVGQGGTWGYDKILAGRSYEKQSYSSSNKLLNRNLTRWEKTQGWTHSQGASAERQARITNQQSFVYDDEGNELSATTKFEYVGDLTLRETPVLTSKITTYDYVAVAGSSSALPTPDPNGTPEPNPTPVPTPIPPTPILIKELTYLETDTAISSTIKDAYKAKNIIGRATRIKLINPNNANDIFSETQFVYDEGGAYATIDYGPTTGYVAPTGTYANLRGFPTTQKSWNKDANNWIETHSQFDNFGNVRKVWDSTGDTSRFNESFYDPVYKYAFVTKVKTPAPDPTGVHGMTESSEVTRTYDFVTGLIQSITDANGQTATIEYDSLFRVKKILPPAGGSITEKIYNDDANNLWVKIRKQINENSWAEQTTFYDTLGRPYKNQIKDLQGDVFTEIKYDSIGRTEKTSNPYRQNEQKLWNKARYDDAGRVVEAYAPAPDGQAGISLGTTEFGISTVSNFVGPYVVTHDTSGRKKRIISNIYGISRVDEPTGIGGTTESDLGTLENPHQPSFFTYNARWELIKITQGKPNQTGQPIQNRYFMYDSLGRLIRVRQPEQTPNANLATTGNPENNQWTSGYSYDHVGNVKKVTDAKGINIINEYDKVGRINTRCYTKPQTQTNVTQCNQLSSSEINLDTPQVDYYYDGKGLPQVPQFSRGSLTKITNGISESRYTSFNNHGRLLASQQITNGEIYNFGYKYNLSGALIEETYPSGRIVKNFLDTDGGLATVSSKAVNGQTKTIATNFDYSASGDVKKMMLGNGLWETAQISELSQLTQLGLGNSSTDTSIWKEVYEYGELSNDGTSVNTSKNIGNIARKTTSVPNNTFIQTYRYDAVDRLTEAKEVNSGGAENWKQTFGYDRFGNRTNFSQTIGGVPLQLNNINHPTINPNNNQFTTGQGYVYDYNGNLVQDAEGRNFTFNGDDKQIEVKNSSQEVVGKYYYDGLGTRVKKVTATETTVFVYDGGGVLAAEYSTKHNSEPTISYLTTDHLGSPRVVTDKSGNVISRRDFMPFGEEIYAGVGGRSVSLKYSLTGADNIRQRFTGYEKDIETGLDFAQARMYQNSHGRFTAVDPLMASAAATNPQTFNRYTYTGNNPIKYTDPSGLLYYRNNKTGKLQWFDKDPGSEWTDVTGEIWIVGTAGSELSAAGATDGSIVIIGDTRGDITVINNPTSEELAIANGENVVDEVVQVVSDAATESIEYISRGIMDPGSYFAPTLDPIVTNPIDIGTGTGGGPLEKPGSGLPDGGTDTGGGEPDVDGGSGVGWEDIGLWGYVIGKYYLEKWLNGDFDKKEEEGNYVYRSLSATDDPDNGLSARNPANASVTPISHVAGKKDSPWISTTKDENVARDKFDKHDKGGNGIVRIDLDKVSSEIVDLSNGIPGYERSRQSNWAKKDKEVLIRGYIPPNAIEKLK